MHVYVALRNHKLLWLSWVEAHGFPTLRFVKASIINSEVNWNVWCSWNVLWKFLESFLELYPYISIIFVRQESTSDGSPVSSNGSTHATDSMDGNQSSWHHEAWPSPGTFEWWHFQIISSPRWNEKNETVQHSCCNLYMNHGFGNVSIILCKWL